jgi:hypothetical protein
MRNFKLNTKTANPCKFKILVSVIILISLSTSLCFTNVCNAQAISRYNPDTVLTVVLDKDVIKSARAGLYVEDFIEEIKKDTSFYQAFKNMKSYAFTAENTVITYDKNNKVKGRIFRRILHQNDKKGHKMTYLKKESSGDLYKRNGNYELYTVEMFDYIFLNEYNSDFTESTVGSSIAIKGGRNESYKDKLKTLVFSPGKPIKGIPFISDKTEIFNPEMRKNYNYSFASGKYLDSIPVYRFTVKMKPDLSDWTKDGIMIKELTTIFDKRNFQILGRYIDMKMNNFVFSFDVQMNIEMSYFGENLLPTKISYQGNWDIPFKKEERASFLVLHKDYKPEKH